ncbi:hypothetical protein Leryth_001427 [Lithospermum erythrorhizon]|nr:hypothetical protein Leryth_001427 [Lithospermum erythrorhizon]
MELGLSLGNETTSSKAVVHNSSERQSNSCSSTNTNNNHTLSFCMALGIGHAFNKPKKFQENGEKFQKNGENIKENGEKVCDEDGGDESPVQLNLLPCEPVPRPSPWSSDNASSDNGSSGNMALPEARVLDLTRRPRIGGGEEVSSANSVAAVPLQMMEFTSFYKNSGGNGFISGRNKRDFEAAGNDTFDAEIAGSRGSDEDENGVNARKKLRLSKEQSAFLEESFKEHNTLNPWQKQKLALAKQLNLRPRQVEVWFQNRRARTKLKQTEVDCEYLKRCCETLTEENRRLHKELQELRALKSSSPFYMQSPATTLTMCPSCERVATTSNRA